MPSETYKVVHLVQDEEIQAFGQTDSGGRYFAACGEFVDAPGIITDQLGAVFLAVHERTGVPLERLHALLGPRPHLFAKRGTLVLYGGDDDA